MTAQVTFTKPLTRHLQNVYDTKLVSSPSTSLQRKDLHIGFIPKNGPSSRRLQRLVGFYIHRLKCPLLSKANKSVKSPRFQPKSPAVFSCHKVLKHLTNSVTFSLLFRSLRNPPNLYL